ncbi:MAG: Eco57I restriction-modification methylase domain-containing protein, partial [Burkholderiales bacterium]
MVQCLLDSALDPVVDEVIKQSDPEKAILNLKVCDPACGSGHFLIAAAHRMAKRLAAIRTGDGEPSPEAVRKALRDVIGHCIYGVDINPMAVELCKVSLWMESLEPGKPLTFLEHRIQPGNALIGATPALLKKGIPDEAFKPVEGDDKEFCAEYKRLNKNERLRFQDLFVSPREPWEMLGNLAVGLMGLEEIGNDDIADIHRKQERWEQLVRSSDYINSQLLADAWCAAFVWRKIRDSNHPYPITEEMFRRIEENPWHVARTHHETEIRRLAQRYQFFHWHLAFSDVFRVPVNEEMPGNEQAGWKGGFDIVVGNPPWEKLQTEELQFFAARNPEIAALKGARRKAAIKALKETDPTLEKEWREQRRIDAATIAFIRNSNTYPLTGVGKFNTFALFAELNNRLMSSAGRVGCIVPSGVATDDTTKLFFQHITTSNSLVSLFDFENRDAIFPGVHRSYKFCLLTLSGKDRPISRGADFAFFAHSVEDLRDEQRRFTLSSADIALLNPNTLTCATFRSRRDAEITKAIYRRVPIFLNEKKPQQNAYQPQVWRLLNTTDDSEDFVGFNGERRSELVPVIEAKTIHQFDHRFASFPEAGGDDADAYEIPSEAKTSPRLESLARYYITDQLFRERMPEPLRDKRWFLTARNIARSTDERTVIASIIPRGASCEHTPYIEVVGGAQVSAFLTGLFNSFALDYAARQKVGGTTLSYFILYQFPILFPRKDLAISLEFFAPRVLELTCTAYDVRGFADDCGYTGEPFRWDEARRFLLRCELDAAYFHLYGIAREDVDYILDTFPIVRRKDEAQHGEYRTKRVILEIYDAMQQAIMTWQPYQRRLDPPPANGWTPPELQQEEVVAKPVAQPVD